MMLLLLFIINKCHVIDILLDLDSSTHPPVFWNYIIFVLMISL